MIEKVFSRFTTLEPNSLLRLSLQIAIVSFLLIVSVSTLGIYRAYEAYIIHNAEQDAVRIGQLIVAQEEEYLLRTEGSGKNAETLMDAEILNSLDQSLRRFLTPFNILKIKVFNTNGIVVYSTDPTIIGEDSSSSPSLQIALTGGIDSKLQTKDSIHNLQFVEKSKVDVVETYIPIFSRSHQVIGSFEIYKDITSYRAAVKTGVISSVSILAAILVIIFSAAYLLLRIAISQLHNTQEQLKLIATTDELTALLNRRELMKRAEQEFLRQKRAPLGSQIATFSVVMIDIDHFKQVNDHFGHAAGDYVLKRFAKTLKEQCRGYSHLGRYGGEEFLILLPDTSKDDALIVAERIRLAVRSCSFTHNEQCLNITLSIGVASANQQDTDFDEVLLRADRALYRAKETGRDRVVTDEDSAIEDSDKIINELLFTE